ncbi:MAG: hypothetical protein LBV43_02740, partial [Prevotella sp.]|nr:hypothetical protein [Prevotella sp.]
KGYLPDSDKGRFITDSVYGIFIGIYTRGITRTFMWEGRPLNNIYLEFETPIQENYYTRNSEDIGWTEEVYTYFRDMKIKRVNYLSGVDLSKGRKERLKRKKEREEKKKDLLLSKN